MAIEIQDGTGNGKRAGVDDNNKLLVLATTHSEAHIASFTQGRAYVANTNDTADTLTTTATGGPILYLQNTSATLSLVVEDVCLASSAGGVVVTCTRNPTLGTIGNENTHTPPNLNFASGSAAEVTAYNWDEVGDGMTGLSGGTSLGTVITSAGTMGMDLDGVVILGQNDSIMISVAGAAEFAARIRFYFDETEFE